MTDKTLSRRRVTTLAGAGALLVLAGCGDTDPDEDLNGIDGENGDLGDEGDGGEEDL